MDAKKKYKSARSYPLTWFDPPKTLGKRSWCLSSYMQKKEVARVQEVTQKIFKIFQLFLKK